MKVLIIGSGAYVCGKGVDEFGTILPSLIELSRYGLVSELAIFARSSAKNEMIKNKILEISNKLNCIVNIQIYNNMEASLEKFKPNAAVVSTPDSTHFEITKVLLENKIHTLVVKPLTNTLKNNIELVALAKKNGVIGAVEYHKRYDKANLIMKDMILNNSLGSISQFNIEYSQRKTIPENTFTSWVDDTDIFQYLGVHYVDLIYFMTGAIPVKVMGIGSSKYLTLKNIDNYDSILTIIKWKNIDNSEFISNHTTGWIDANTSTSMSNQKIKVFGTLGEYESDQRDRGIRYLTNNGYEHINPYFSKFILDDIGYKFDGYAVESIKNFLQSAQLNKCVNIATFKSSLIVSKVIEANKKSLVTNNNWINVE